MLNTDVRWYTPWTSTPGHYLNFELEVREQRTTYYLKQILVQVLQALSSGWNKSSFHIFLFINVFLHLGWISGPPPRPQPPCGNGDHNQPGPRDCMIHVGSCGTKAIVACVLKPLTDSQPPSHEDGWRILVTNALTKGCFPSWFWLRLYTKTKSCIFFEEYHWLGNSTCTMHREYRDVQVEKLIGT